MLSIHTPLSYSKTPLLIWSTTRVYLYQQHMHYHIYNAWTRHNVFWIDPLHDSAFNRAAVCMFTTDLTRHRHGSNYSWFIDKVLLVSRFVHVLDFGWKSFYGHRRNWYLLCIDAKQKTLRNIQIWMIFMSVQWVSRKEING